MADDLRQRAREWITGFLAASDEDRVNCVALLLDSAERAHRCVAGHHALLQEQAVFEKHRADTYLADYNFLDLQFRAKSRELAHLKAEGARDA